MAGQLAPITTQIHQGADNAGTGEAQGGALPHYSQQRADSSAMRPSGNNNGAKTSVFDSKQQYQITPAHSKHATDMQGQHSGRSGDSADAAGGIDANTSSATKGSGSARPRRKRRRTRGKRRQHTPFAEMTWEEKHRRLQQSERNKRQAAAKVCAFNPLASQRHFLRCRRRYRRTHWLVMRLHSCSMQHNLGTQGAAPGDIAPSDMFGDSDLGGSQAGDSGSGWETDESETDDLHLGGIGDLLSAYVADVTADAAESNAAADAVGTSPHETPGVLAGAGAEAPPDAPSATAAAAAAAAAPISAANGTMMLEMPLAAEAPVGAAPVAGEHTPRRVPASPAAAPLPGLHLLATPSGFSLDGGPVTLTGGARSSDTMAAGTAVGLPVTVGWGAGGDGGGSLPAPALFPRRRSDTMDSTDEPDEFRALTRGDLVRKLMAAKSAIGKMAERAASAEAEADQLRRHMVSVTSAAAAAEGRARSRSWGAAGMQLGVPGGGVYAEGGGVAAKEATGGGSSRVGGHKRPRRDRGRQRERRRAAASNSADGQQGETQQQTQPQQQ